MPAEPASWRCVLPRWRRRRRTALPNWRAMRWLVAIAHLLPPAGLKFHERETDVRHSPAALLREPDGGLSLLGAVVNRQGALLDGVAGELLRPIDGVGREV